MLENLYFFFCFLRGYTVCQNIPGLGGTDAVVHGATLMETVIDLMLTLCLLEIVNWFHKYDQNLIVVRSKILKDTWIL